MTVLSAKGRNGEMSFDGNHVTIKRSGFRVALTTGGGEKRVPVGQISAVQWYGASKLNPGFIKIIYGGGSELKGSFGVHVLKVAADDGDAILFGRKSAEAFEALRTAIEAAIASRSSGVTSSHEVDSAAKLQQLASLRDSGIISPQEFEAKKAQILEQF